MGSWKKGQSGNPKGRPKKQRALAELLQAALDEPVVVGGEEFTGKEALARAVMRAVILGEVQVGERVLRVESFEEWMQCARWVYTHIDGPVKPDVGDNQITVTVERGRGFELED